MWYLFLLFLFILHSYTNITLYHKHWKKFWYFLGFRTEKMMAPHSSTLGWKSHGWRRLVGCSPWGCEESDTTDHLHFHFSLSCLEESRNYSCVIEAISKISFKSMLISPTLFNASFIDLKSYTYECLFYSLNCLPFPKPIPCCFD